MITYKLIDGPYGYNVWLYIEDAFICRVVINESDVRGTLVGWRNNWNSGVAWDIDEAYIVCCVARDELIDMGLL